MVLFRLQNYGPPLLKLRRAFLFSGRIFRKLTIDLSPPLFARGPYRDAQRVLVAQTSARLPDGQVCALFFNSSTNQNHTG